MRALPEESLLRHLHTGKIAITAALGLFLDLAAIFLSLLALGRYWCSHIVNDRRYRELRGGEKKRGLEMRKSEVGGGGIICAGLVSPHSTLRPSCAYDLISTWSHLLLHPIHDSRSLLNKAVRVLFLQECTLQKWPPQQQLQLQPPPPSSSRPPTTSHPSSPRNQTAPRDTPSSRNGPH